MLPESGNSEGSVMGYATVEDQRGPIETELRGYEFEDETLANRASVTCPNPKKRSKLSSPDPIYTTRTINDGTLPKKPSDEKQLYAPLAALIEAINVHFQLNKQRAVLQVHNTKMKHVEGSDSASQYPRCTKEKRQLQLHLHRQFRL